MTNQTDQTPKSEQDIIEEQAEKIKKRFIDFSKKPKKLGELLEEIMPEGERVKVADIEGWVIVIHSIRAFTGQFGIGLYTIFTDENGAIYNTIIGQKLLVEKLIAVQEELPIECTIVKHEGGQFGRYYDFAGAEE